MLRYGLIGAGGVGQIHLRWAGRHPRVELCAIADPDQARCADLVSEASAKLYADHRQMLANERLDMVSIAVPHDRLAEVATDCLDAGCHILVEKPLTRHVGEAEQLLALARSKNLQVGVCYQYRNFATPQLIKTIIDSGQIGELQHIVWTWHELRPASYYSDTPWRGSWDGAGGGLLMNQLIHDLDLLRWFAGDVASVQASIANQAHDTPLEDSVSASLHFRSGARATIAATLNHSRTHNYRALMGTKGLIVLPDAKSLAGNPGDQVMVGVYSDATDAAIASYQDDHQQSQIEWASTNSQPQSARRLLPEWAKAPIRGIADTIRPKRHGWDRGQRPTSGHGKTVWNFIDAIVAGDNVPGTMSGENAYRTLELANAMIFSGIEKRQIDLPLDPAAYSALFGKLVAGEIAIPSSIRDDDAPA